MTPFHILGILIRSTVQGTLLVYLLDSMSLINANSLLYIIFSTLFFLIRFVFTKEIMKTDLNYFFLKSQSFTKEILTKSNFTRMYTLLDPERKIYLKNKNALLYILFNNEILGIIDSEDDHLVELRTINYYYL